MKTICEANLCKASAHEFGRKQFECAELGFSSMPHPLGKVGYEGQQSLPLGFGVNCEF